MEIGDKLTGPNGHKYMVVAVDGDYTAAERDDKTEGVRDKDGYKILPDLIRLKVSEIKNWTNASNSN